MSRLAHATFAAPGLEAERRNLDATVQHEAREANRLQSQTGMARTEALKVARGGPTPGYRCVHGIGYKCATCYAQPGEVDYL